MIFMQISFHRHKKLKFSFHVENKIKQNILIVEHTEVSEVI